MAETLSEKLELEKQINNLISFTEEDLQTIFSAANHDALERMRVFRLELSGLLAKLNVQTDDLDDLVTDTQLASKILILVASYFEVSKEELLGRNRSKEFALPRQIAIYLIYRFVPVSTLWVGKFFDNRDHTTICSAIQKVEKLIDEDSVVYKQIERLESQIGAQPTTRNKNPRRGVRVSPENYEKIIRGIQARRERDARKTQHDQKS